MFVCCECCVLSGRGLCGGLITRPEESYRLWCVVVCDLETSSRMRRSWPALGCSTIGKKIYVCPLKVLCTVSRPITTLDCVLLKGSNRASVARLGPEINSRPGNVTKLSFRYFQEGYENCMLWVKPAHECGRVVSPTHRPPFPSPTHPSPPRDILITISVRGWVDPGS